jgi:DNA-binding PadR family transcriptional regulator
VIGKLEEIVLLAALKVGAEALPSAIYEQVVDTTPDGHRAPAFGAVYTTLNRMADKKMLVLGATRDARGRERRTFTVSASGQSALQAGVRQVIALGGLAWAGG